MTLKVCVSGSIRHKINAGGAAWFYLSWALGLKENGCEVIWLESADPVMSECELRDYITALKNRLASYGLGNRIALCSWEGTHLPWDNSGLYVPLDAAIEEADLFLNAGYFPHPDLVRFRRRVFIDSDPGLVQRWMSAGLLSLPKHDIYFTTGETIGTPEARVPDCGLRWHFTPDPVFLPAWPITPAPAAAPFTTVANWWDKFEELDGQYVSNDKRSSFLEYLYLPSRTSMRLELALTLTDDEADIEERRVLEQNGWLVRSLWRIPWTPDDYGDYIRQSRGEFSCSKPLFVFLQSSVVHDRTLHYMASGKPAIVQCTGPSKFLPDSEGLFRFRNMGEAVRALDAVQSDYERHCRAARALTEEYFDAKKVVKNVLERALA